MLGVGGVQIPWDTLILSVVLFVVIPLAGGVITRNVVVKKRGLDVSDLLYCLPGQQGFEAAG